LSAVIRAWSLARLGAVVGLNQVGIQALGFVSALLIVRFLPTEEYALYTLTLAFLMTAVGLADGGVSNGVMAEGGKVWTQRKALADVVTTGMAVRRIFAPWALLVCIPAMLWMLRRHGADWGTCLALTATVVVAFLATLSTSVYEVPLKLRQELGPLQRLNLAAAALRAALIGAALTLLAWAAAALAVNAAVQVAIAWRVRALAAPAGQPAGVVDPKVRASILRVVARTLPGVIYFAISGQLTIWLLSLFGTTEAVAQVGALGRLAAVLTVVTGMMSLIVAPRFARLPNDRAVLFNRYWAVLAALVLVSAAVCGAVWCFPVATLAVLGPKYADLHTEALLMATTSCLTMIAGTLSSLAASRGLLLRPVVALPIGIGANVLAVAVADVTTALGVLTMGVGLAAFSVLFAVAAGAWLLAKNAR